MTAVVATPEPVVSRQAVDLQLSPEEQAWLADNPVVRIAPAPNFPPIEFFTAQGEYVGIAADYVELIESRLGIAFDVEQRASWDEVLSGTQAREVDVWMEAGITAERQEYMLFSEPYLTHAAVIIVRREITGVSSMDDLRGLRVGVIEGYASSDFVRDSHPELQLIDVPSIQTGVERVSFGSADALIANVAAASYYIEQANLTNLRVAGESGFVWELALATRNDWPVLHGILEKALNSISDDERRAINRRWIVLDVTPGGAGIRWYQVAAGLALLFAMGLVLWRVTGWRVSTGELAGRGQLIRSWPVMLVGAVAVATVVIGAVRAQSILAERARLDVENALQTVLNTTSNSVHDWFRARETEAAAWAARTDVQDEALRLASLRERGQPTAGTAAATRLGQVLDPAIGTGMYQRFLLMTPAGDPLIGSRDSEAAIDADLAMSSGLVRRVRDSVQHAARALPEQTETADGDLYVLPSILLGQGIQDSAGELQAIIVFWLDPTAGFSAILQRARLGESGETYAINRQGQLISASRFDDDLIQAGLITRGDSAVLNVVVRDPGGNLQTGFKPSPNQDDWPLTRMAESAVSGESGIDLVGYNDYRGVSVVGAWVWDDATGLGIATEINEAEAYTFLRSYEGQSRLATVLAVALLVALTGLFIHNRTRMAAANAALGEAYATIKKHKDRMEDELNVGREIQMSMVPLTFPAFPERSEFSVKAALMPAREVGGDFYDFFFIDDHRFCICIGDVAGKGVPAALFMAVTKTLIKSRAVDSTSTASIVDHVNTELSENNAESMFVTLFVGILDLRSGELLYSNAGHNPPYLRRPNGSILRIDARHGPVVGAVSHIEYAQDRLTLEPDDLLVLYTDGVTEAFDPSGHLFSEDRFAQVVAAGRDWTADSCVDETVSAVRRFIAEAEQSDDITVLAVQYHGAAGTV